MNLHSLTIKQAHEGLSKKEFSSVELTEAVLAQIEKKDGDIHAYLKTSREPAMAQALSCDNKIKSGDEISTLSGIPMALKDNMLVKGEITTSGSKILENYKSSYDATVVTKLKEIGAVIVGKTNMDEFAMGSSTENSAFGPTKNPWDLNRVPGGSSGGSAAAVSADECIYALGSDTGGSIRQPASLSGVVGLKPTYGSVSRYGLMAMASSLDQIGPFTKSVQDAALVFDAIKGADERDSSSKKSTTEPIANLLTGDIKGLRVGLPKEYFVEGMDKDVAETINTAIKKLESLGAEIVDISLPHTNYALSVYYVLMPAEVSANLARFDGMRYGLSSTEASNLIDTYAKSRGAGLGAEPRRRVILGTYVLASGYYDAYYKQAQKVRALVRQDYSYAYKNVDVIVTPTSPIPAFKLGELSTDPLQMYLADIFTVSCNIVGVPGVSVPCGFVQRDGVDLPVGLQLLGKHFDEQTILNTALAYEQSTDWHLRHALTD